METVNSVWGGEIEIGVAPVSVKYTQLFIDGQFLNAVSGKTFKSFDPRTGDPIADFAEADKEDVDLAVKAARRAFDEGPWPRMSGYERGQVLFKFADLIEKNSDEITSLETLDNGKPIELANFFDMRLSLQIVRYYAGLADKIFGTKIRFNGPYEASTVYEPFGVVGVITPWNFPLIMFVMKTCPALACGNTVVIKPAEQTPLTALFLASLAQEAGFPPGVLNVVPGFGSTAGSAITSHMDIDKVSFTGSTNIGRIVMEAAAKSNLKPVTLELGGKSPLIICDDVDLDEAVETAHQALFINQGQICVAGSRTFVQEGIYDEFLKRATERAKKQVVGDPFRKGVQQGPQINEAQTNRILDYIKSGKDEGARLLIGGNRIGDRGFFIEPTIFADVQDDMKISREEIFGPVMSIFKFKTLDEAVKRANDSVYGLAAGVMTKNIDAANMISRSLKAGIVWINCYCVFDSNTSFGGYKMSGFGRELGMAGMLENMQIKSIVSPLKNSPWL